MPALSERHRLLVMGKQLISHLNKRVGIVLSQRLAIAVKHDFELFQRLFFGLQVR
jgi:hypothetical protein